ADLSGSAPILLPNRLLTFGSKQGVVYLLNRDALPGALDRRPKCDPGALDPSLEKSLVPPTPAPYLANGARGPLSVFGPYSDGPNDNNLDRAKMRTTPAFFVENGAPRVIVSGSTKQDGDVSIAPGLAKLRVESTYLAIDATSDVVFRNAGSPIVTSHDGGV